MQTQKNGTNGKNGHAPDLGTLVATLMTQVASIQEDDEIGEPADLLKNPEKLAGVLGIVGTGTALFSALAEMAPDVLAPIVGSILDLFAETSERLEKQDKRWAKMKARDKKTQFDAYVKAGFGKKDAMALVLAETRPMDWSALTRGLNSGSGKDTKK